MLIAILNLTFFYLRHGYGTLSYRLENGVYKLQYEGDWVRGKPEGIGRWWHENGDIYFGFWNKGKRHGFGKMWYADGTYYVGYWAKGDKNGLGMFVCSKYPKLFDANKAYVQIRPKVTKLL